MPSAPALVEECTLPRLSVLDPAFVHAAYFQDSYRAPLRRGHATPVDIFHGIFAHQPAWMKVVMVARNRLASLWGIDAPTAAEIMRPVVRTNYAVGDKIGPWPIFALTDNELVAGRDNKHLDFRLSVLRESSGQAASVVVSTVCLVHNSFGKLYLFCIVPLHKWGVRRLIKTAAMAGRL